MGGYATFLRHVVSSLRGIRPDVVCVVNEELAFLLLPFKRTLYHKIVCELYDPLDARHTGASIVARVVSRIVSAIALRFSDRLVVTDENRLSMVAAYAQKAKVIENFPEDPGPELAGKMPEGPLKIWAAGSLDEAHGLRQLLEAIQPLRDISVVSAGWLYDRFAEERFVLSDRVDYKGILSAAKALELAAGCDAVFCYYAPVNVNMINASPNKINDAMAIGRPVLINSEVKIASWVVAAGVGHACAYEDVQALRQAIVSCVSDRAGLPAIARRIRAQFGERSWNSQERGLAQLYRDLAADVE